MSLAIKRIAFKAKLRNLGRFLCSRQMKHAIKTAIAAVICLILYKSEHLPKGYWAVITAIVVMQSTADTGSLESTLRLAWQRLVGTMTGAAIGLAFHVWFQPTYLELIIVVFALIVLGVCVTYFWSSMKLAGTTAVLVLLFAGHKTMSHNTAILRGMEILIGASVALVVSVCIWPRRMHQHLFRNYKLHMQQILIYFMDLEQAFSNKEMLSTFDLSHISQLLTMVDKEKAHLTNLMRARRLTIASILTRQIRLLKNIKLISKSIGSIPVSYYEDRHLMSVTQLVFKTIAEGMQAIISGKINQSHFEYIPELIAQYDNALDCYRQKNIFQQLTMDESFAIVSLSIALKKMLDLMIELMRMNKYTSATSFF